MTWLSTGYPASLPYTNVRNFYLAMCDIGPGAAFIRPGVYNVSWTGSGKVGFSPSQATIVNNKTSSNWMTVRLSVTGTSGLSVRLLRSSASNPVTRISIVPIEIQDTYQTQIFHPDFLNLLRGYDHVRFTQWMKLVSNQAKTWSTRTLPSSQTQHRSEGVAIEHMVDLIRVANLSSAWFSFPTGSTDYNTNMLTLLSTTLPTNRPIKIYIEAGSLESHQDTDRKAESLALFASAQTIFKNNKNIQIVPSASIHNYAYVPYLLNWFSTSFSSLKAIGVTAQFGRSVTSNDHISSYGFWDNTYANYSLPDIIQEVRNSVFIADHMLNSMRQKLLSAKTDFELVGVNGGPYFSAPTYTYRSAVQVVTDCALKSQFPCQWANTKTYARNQSEVDALMPALKFNASMEQKVEDLLIAATRAPEIYDIYLDFLRRWEALGGGLISSNTLVRVANRCLQGGDRCGSEGLFENPLDLFNCTTRWTGPSDHPTISPCQKYWPLRHYKEGIRSKLPYTAGDAVKPAVIACNPSCKWGDCFKGVCHCFAGYSGADCSTLITTKPAKLNDCNNDTGINLAGIADWSSETPFVDLFLTARAWISQDFMGTAWSTETNQYLRTDGYPSNLTASQKLGSMMIRDLQAHIKTGRYVVLFDGDGVITFGMDVITVKRSLGRIEIEVVPSTGLNNGIFLMIERTNPLNPIRNIRVIMPGYEDKYEVFPFHPVFLDKMKPFKTIRFMDWMNTNGVLRGNWSDRTILNVNTRGFTGSSEINGEQTPRTGSGGFGVSIEYMVHLVNLLGVNAWFNMPHLATDEYVRNFATLVKTTIRPDVKIYIEYSNEVWGTLFSGGQYAQTMGIQLGLSTGAATARFCYLVMRSNQMFHIWREVFDGDSNRLEFVINSQSVNPDVTKQLLACSTLLSSKPAYSSLTLIHTAIAIAPYFGSYSYTKDKDLNIYMNTTLPAQIASLATEVKGHSAFAKANGLKLLTYESGQGLQGSGKTDDLGLIANRDTRMESLYQRYYNLLRKNGVSLMMAFTSTALPSTSAYWGTLESTDQDPKSAFKYRGLLDYIEEHSTCAADVYDALASSGSVIGASADEIATEGTGFSCQFDCSNSGLCVDQDVCECYYGSQGRFCDNTYYTEHTDYCGYKCTFDQGKCVPDYVVGGTDRYWKCECKTGYYGPQCSLFDCVGNCNYNGKCLDANICHCFPGFLGNTCEIDCGCDGHGTCTPDAVAAYSKGQSDFSTLTSPTCLCDIGYTWSNEERQCVAVCASSTSQQSQAVPFSSDECSPSSSCSNTCDYGTCTTRVATATNVPFETCECWAGYTGTFCNISNPASRMNRDSIIGTNLGGTAYYSPEIVFVDAFKMSSDWVSVWKDGWTLVNTYAWGNGQPIHLRQEDGYPAYLEPGQVLVKLMLRDIHKHSVIQTVEEGGDGENGRGSSRYVCLFDGEGEIDFGMDAKVTAIGKNRIEFYFKPTDIPGCTAAYCSDNGIYLRLLATNPENPVRNIRVIMPGFEHNYASQVFYPPFLDSIRRYSVVRFKDWQRVDGSTERHWATDRSTPMYHSQATSRGVALEHMIDLCNRLAINPWFSMPLNATDDYVKQFATMVKDKLRPDLKVYVELSNEVWNGLFQQGKDAQSIGMALGLSNQRYTAGYRYFAQRSSEMFHIWEDVLNDHHQWNDAFNVTAASNDTDITVTNVDEVPITKLSLVKVMSTFTVAQYATKEILSWMKRVNGSADVLGVAGYWDCGGLGGSSHVAKTALMSVNEVLQACVNDLPNVMSYLKMQQRLASTYGMKLQTYEAGQSLVEYNVMAYGNGETPGLTSLFHRANRDPGMTQVYIKYINAYLSNNVISFENPMLTFTSCGPFSKYGSWGHTEYTGQFIEQAPKYLALRQYFYYNDPSQMLLRFPQAFRDSVKYLSSSTSSASSMVSVVSRFRYVNRFLTKIKMNGVIPYEVDISCLICIPPPGTEGTSSSPCPNYVPWNGDYSYIGYPHVTSPRRGDILVVGNSRQRHVVTWNVPADGTKIGRTVAVRLWKSAFCGLNGAQSKKYGGQLIYDFSDTPIAFSAGRFEFSVTDLPVNPATLAALFDGSETYFFEIRGNNYHSYFSEVFTVLAAGIMEMPLLSAHSTIECNSSLITNVASGSGLVTVSPVGLTLDSCTVTRDTHFQSSVATVPSVWAVNLVIPNQVCMTEYSTATQSNALTSMKNLKLSSCYTSAFASSAATTASVPTATACRLIRTQGNGKPITDCVASLSPYPALLSQEERAALPSNFLSPMTKQDYDEYLQTVGWQPLTFQTKDECHPFEEQLQRRLSNSPSSAVSLLSVALEHCPVPRVPYAADNGNVHRSLRTAA